MRWLAGVWRSSTGFDGSGEREGRLKSMAFSTLRASSFHAKLCFFQLVCWRQGASVVGKAAFTKDLGNKDASHELRSNKTHYSCLCNKIPPSSCLQGHLNAARDDSRPRFYLCDETISIGRIPMCIGHLLATTESCLTRVS